MYKLAVIGNPINQSLSPLVFKLFSEQFNIDLSYEKIFAQDTNDFKHVVDSFFTNGGLALNITSPYKHEAYLIAKQSTTRTKFCKASNFLYLDNNKHIIANTTDGIGLINDLEDQNQQVLLNKKILIIGSGFVLDSILLDLISKNPHSIAILARNKSRVDFLQKKFGVDSHNKNGIYDMIINSVPNVPENNLFEDISNIKDGSFCYDLTYHHTKTLFLQSMNNLNPHTVQQDGLGMMVEQAKIAFTQLFGKTPNSKKVINQIRPHQ